MSVEAGAGGGTDATGAEKSNKSTTLGSGADAGAATGLIAGLIVRGAAGGVGRDANAGGGAENGAEGIGGAGPSSLP